MSAYSWGLGKHGQLCNGKTDNLIIPYNITKCTGGKKLGPVVDICCGAHFTAVLCNDGSLYTSGCGKYGRLGHGLEEDNCAVLKPVVDVSRVKNISCGFWHAACVTEESHVYVWGYSKAVGADTANAGKTQNIGVPKIISFGSEVKISGVSCGYNFTFAWTIDGQAFSWGRGQHGVLGHRSEQDYGSPKKIDDLKDKMVVNVGAGHSHCGIVSADGDLFMTGSGSDGALGVSLSQQHCALVPIKVPLMDEVKEVCCSKGEHHHHTLTLLKDGNVLSWGDGYKGKLGLGDQESRDKPTVIPPEHFHNEKVVRISAGGIHSAASTEKGSVFTWGCGSDGRLGHPEAEGHRYLFRSDIPRKVEGIASGGKAPALVSCSYYHTAAIVYN